MTSTTAAAPWKVRRARLLTAVREKGEAILPFSLTGMSRKDAARWRSARTMADLGVLVIAWLNGEITQTPGHCGPPCDETDPLRPFLTAMNRGGFVTDCSQLAESADGRAWNTWVDGFASDATLAKLREAVAGKPLILGACRGRSHEHRHVGHVARCCWKELVDFWAECCPAVADELSASWFVAIEDPEPGRNDLLWPALTAALESRR